MKDEVKTGMNRTGMDMSPLDSRDLMDVTGNVQTGVMNSTDTIAKQRNLYVVNASLVGSVPMPGTLKGMANTALQKLKGNEPALLLDKLGQRLAFERTGTRLYELFISKCNAHQEQAELFSLDLLGQIHREELRHFEMLVDVVKGLGGDPTAQTPGADVCGVTASGILQVLSDPRTTLSQCVDAILLAELDDNEGWEVLIRVAEGAGLDDLAAQFQRALSEERQHLAEIRGLRNRLLFGAPEAH